MLQKIQHGNVILRATNRQGEWWGGEGGGRRRVVGAPERAAFQRPTFGGSKAAGPSDG